MTHRLIQIGPTACLWTARAAILLIVFKALMPSVSLMPVLFADKILHFLAYGTVAGLLALGRGPGRWRAIAAAVFVFSVIIEILQAVMGLGRDGSWGDLVANAGGIICGLTVGLVLQAWLSRRFGWRIVDHSAAASSSSG